MTTYEPVRFLIDTSEIKDKIDELHEATTRRLASAQPSSSHALRLKDLLRDEVDYLLDELILDEGYPLEARRDAIKDLTSYVKSLSWKDPYRLRKITLGSLKKAKKDLRSEAALDFRAQQVEEELNALDYKTASPRISGQFIRLDPYGSGTPLIKEYINTRETEDQGYLDFSKREIISWFRMLYNRGYPKIGTLDKLPLTTKQKMLRNVEKYLYESGYDDIIARAIKRNIKQAKRDLYDEETYIVSSDEMTRKKLAYQNVY